VEIKVPEKALFREILVVMDDQTWVWNFVSSQMQRMGVPFVRMASGMSLRRGWNRFRSADRIIIHWENTQRSGGAMIEEIAEIDQRFDIAERVIVLTTNPTHEDVVYFSELGVKRIMRLRQRDKDLEVASPELEAHLTRLPDKSAADTAWRRVLHAIDRLRGRTSSPGVEDHLAKLTRAIENLAPTEETRTARYWDAKAAIEALRGNHEVAEKWWRVAFEKNPNYYRAYNNFVGWMQERGRLKEALAVLKRMQELNGNSIARIAAIGEIHVAQGDDAKGEAAFQHALERDAFCSRALNGLAEIRFRHGDLEASRQMLSKSAMAYGIAKKLNDRGIEMVRGNKYEQALEHYTRAQYVLPQQEKGPMLFFNIALCYYRWGRFTLAREFVRIALIKDPRYGKAQRLLQLVDAEISKNQGQPAH
jgi:tetratricopeptide (TPR) repeat protein